MIEVWKVALVSTVVLLGIYAALILDTVGARRESSVMRAEIVELAETNRDLMLRLSLAEQATRAALERPCAE